MSIGSGIFFASIVMGTTMLVFVILVIIAIAKGYLK